MRDEQKSEVASSIGCGMAVRGEQQVHPTECRPWRLSGQDTGAGDGNACMALPELNPCQAVYYFRQTSQRQKGTRFTLHPSPCSVPWEAGLHLGSQAL